MERFLFTQTVTIEKDMDMSFFLSAESWEDAQEKLRSMLQTDDGSFRPISEVLPKKEIEFDHETNPLGRIVDGGHCEFCAKGHREWKPTGKTKVKS